MAKTKRRDSRYYNKVKLEKWKKGYFWVVRNEKGKILTYTTKRNFRLKQDASEYLKQFNTLVKGLEKIGKKKSIRKSKKFTTEKVILTNVSEITKTSPTTLFNVSTSPISKAPKKEVVMYVVGCEITYYSEKLNQFKTESVYASSPNIAVTGQSEQSAKDEAWDKFLKRIGDVVYGEGHYDANDGLDALEKFTYSNLVEGWRYYNPIKNRR